MRLINTSTLELHEFVDAQVAPRYAILSHRWGEDEVSFKDYQKGRGQTGSGYSKIRMCCDFALANGHRWVWIDTCCIDKRSSAELSEAINSMYGWYARAKVCYAFLADVYGCDDGNIRILELQQQLQASSWFTRGWTLQELIAPRCVVFVDCNWNVIGAKHASYDFTSSNASYGVTSGNAEAALPLRLNDVVSKITGIPETVLQARENVYHHSVAQRFSWAAKRKTTRMEDMAYCLLGIFDIKMPLLYGEGRDAFMRLQKEILSRYEDDSIFAWSSWSARLGKQRANDYHWGMLARLPAEFEGATYVTKFGAHARPPHALTNRGIQMPLSVHRAGLSPQNGAFRSSVQADTVYLLLNCGHATVSQSAHVPCALSLRLLPCGHYGRGWMIDMLHSWSRDLSSLPMDWIPLAHDEVLYIHATFMDAVTCSHASANNP